jgi:glycosyltransferase involved in cell wall biosynthesis
MTSPVHKGKQTAQLTVAIATLNRPEALAGCLKAILSGDILPAEIVVVDQSQDDRTRQVVKSFDSSLVSLVYIHHEGRGLGVAQNLAIKAARTTLIAVTDDDCEPTPNWVAKIEQAFASPDSIDGLTGRVVPLGPATSGSYAVSSRTSTQRVEFHGKAMPWYVGSGNNFAVRREWLECIGGNDERLGSGSPGQGGVDMDLFYRLLRAGARIRYEPELLVYHAMTDKAGRIGRRVPYGYGMGACCTLWLRQKDPYALRVLVSWIFLRTSRLCEGLLRRHWMRVYEEGLVLFGTLKGLVHGMSLRSAYPVGFAGKKAQ